MKNEDNPLDVTQLSGAIIDDLVVTALLGHGGMGVVYQAYDPKLQRDLALKFIRPERDADEYEIRLEREARAAAKIGHPNIVGVYDIREYRGHTYISMEYIEGETVREWVDRETRSWRDVLGVFKQAAKGIAAAHAVGVLHRDIKPSNIMVGENGRVRVLDFGIARLWSVDEIEELTASYGELTGDNRSNELAATSACLGTLAFMAPEQLIARVATEKSDQYSFCTSLWETLQGSRQGSRPRTLTLGTATLNSLARATKVRGRAIPGWVRKIIAKGLAPKPEHRHASMAELLELLESDPTRRRGLLGVVASVAVVLAGVIGGRSCAAQQATADCQADAESMAANWQEGTRKRFRNWLLATQLPYADFAAERAIPAIDEYVRNLVETRARVCEAADVEKSWDENLAERAYHCLDERRDHLVTLLELYDQQDGGDIELFVGGVPLALARLPPVANCEDYTWLHTQPVSPSDEETRSEIGAIRGLLVSASAYTRVRRGSPAIKIAEEAHRRAKKLEWAPLLALAKIRLAVALEITGEIDHSIDLLKAAYYLAVVSHADEFAVEAATCLSHLFSRRKDDFDQGLLWIELARMILLRRGEPPTSLLWSEVYGKEGVIYGLMGKRNEALRLFERQLELDRINLGSEHPWVGTDLNNLGYVYGEAGEIETAVSYWRKNLEIVETSLGPAHPQVAAVLRNLAAGEASLGNYEHAKEMLFRALDIRQNLHGSDHYDVAVLHHVLSGIQYEAGDYEQTVAEAHLALETAKHDPGPDSIFVGHIYGNLCIGYEALDRHEEAIEAGRRSLIILSEKLGEKHSDVGSQMSNLATALLENGDLEQAKETIERAVEIQREVEGEDSSSFATVYSKLGSVHYAMGNADTAAEIFEDVCETLEARRPRSRSLASRLDNLALAYIELQRFEDARRSAEAALEIYESLEPGGKRVGFPLTILGDCALAVGNLELASQYHRRALDIRRSHSQVRQAELAVSLVGVGIIEFELMANERARVLFEEVLDLNVERLDIAALAAAKFGLAQIRLREAPRNRQAVEQAREAREAIIAAQRGANKLAVVSAWFAKRDAID